MKLSESLSIISTSAVLVLPTGFAQEAHITGGIYDGKPSPPAPPKERPTFDIQWSKVQYKNGRKVTINRVSPPEIKPAVKTSLSSQQVAQSSVDLENRIKDIKESGGLFMVSATIYDHKITHVKWSHEGEHFECWSNVDWNHLGGFIGFEARNKRYEMMLFSGNSSTQSLKRQNEQGYAVTIPEIPKLPRLDLRGASYRVTKGDETNDKAMEFIEAIHDLYAAEQQRLVVAYQEREKNHAIWRKKQEELRDNPPPKPDLTINFWKRDVVKERREAAAQKGG